MVYRRWFESFDLFIRPDSGLKPFTGMLLEFDDIENNTYNWALLKSTVDPNELIIIAPPKKIIEETRFIILNNEILTFSMYEKDEKIHMSNNEVSKECIEYVKHVLTYINNWQPDNVWVIDIAKDNDDRYGVLEINSFTCSDLYDCDMESIVKSISEQAIKEYKEVFDEL